MPSNLFERRQMRKGRSYNDSSQQIFTVEINCPNSCANAGSGQLIRMAVSKLRRRTLRVLHKSRGEFQSRRKQLMLMGSTFIFCFTSLMDSRMNWKSTKKIVLQ